MAEFSDPFHVSTADAILRGRTTDVYFDRTLEVLEREGADPHVVVEVRATSLPDGWPWAILAGTDEARALLEPREDARLRALPEGSPFGPWEPVLTVEGRYRSFAELETPLLGLICQASGVATAAARCRIAAGERTLLSFGARRMHPAITPMIERAAYMGGCDGVSAIAAAERIGIEPTGTMPHALVLILGDTVRTARAFDEAFGDDVPTIVLIDTFQDEKFEALRVAEALEERLAGIRFDTPGSRRGDLLQLMRETRWELDRRGFEEVEFFVSGGIDERAIERLNPLADGYGVGTHISAAATVDFSLDIVEIEGSSVAKRGKESGRKALLVCDGCEGRSVVPAAPKTATYPCPGCGASVADALALPEEPPPTVPELRDRVLVALDGMELDRPIASVPG